MAQTFTTLYRFTALQGTDPSTNRDGAFPYGRLFLSGNVLYGTTYSGGSWGNGTVFKVDADGSGFTNLHSFTALSAFPPIANGDGACPQAGLIGSGNTLYGTAYRGGRSDYGTVFAVKTNGIGFTTLYSFTNLFNTNGLPNGYDGKAPVARLLLSGNTLFGTTSGAARAGSFGSGGGSIFKVSTNGTGFTNLHNFKPSAYPLPPYTNTDGLEPRAGLILSGSTLYGTAYSGGYYGYGTVFAVNTDGKGFRTLHHFTAAGIFANSDGANPAAGLVLMGDTLYGTAYSGGTSAKGVVFAVNTNGTGFTNLHSFIGGSEGANPRAALTLSGNTLYGTTYLGGTSSRGTIFAINTDGAGFRTLHSFTTGEGGRPTAGLVSSGCTLYGTAANPSASGGFRPGADPSGDQSFDDNGTVFSLSFPPQLAIIPAASKVILTWPTNFAGFDYSGFTLQSTANLASPASWTPVSPAPVVVNGHYTVTNPITGTQQFYRLSQ